MKVWIDTDIGSDVDDALALAYALRHPALDVVGVSTVFGDVALRSRIARALVERAGEGDVPVVTGLGAPLSPDRDGLMFGHEGLGLFDDPAPRRVTRADDDAAGRIAALADAIARAAPDALVAIGPLTNVAALADAGASLPPMTIMGGKTRDVPLPGMVEAIPEWNWYCDPVAVRRVLGAAATPPRVVPIEVTHATRLTAEDLERLAGGDALARTLAVLCDRWLDAQRERFRSDDPRVALHDPLAAATLVLPSLCAFRRCAVAVDDRGGTQRVPDGLRIDVAGDVDNDALRSHLMAAWLNE